MTTRIEKLLSANDTGDTGANQAGMLIPKNRSVLSFFPSLDSAEKNPRAVIECTDPTGKKWTFHFIYYNNKLFGGTRNEYRLTHMTAFTRENNLHPGDSVVLYRQGTEYHIAYSRKRPTVIQGDRLRLGSTWKAITF